MITKTGNAKEGYLLMHSRKSANGKKFIESVRGNINGEECILNFTSVSTIARNTFECVYNEKNCIVFEEDDKVLVSAAYRKVHSLNGTYYVLFTLDYRKKLQSLVYYVVKNEFVAVKNPMRLLGSHVFADGTLFTVDSRLNVSAYTLNIHQRKYVGDVALLDASTYTGRRTYAIVKNASMLYDLGDTSVFSKDLESRVGSGWILLSDKEGFSCIITTGSGVLHDKIVDVITECEIEKTNAKSTVLLCHDSDANYWVWRGRCAKIDQAIKYDGFYMLDKSRIKLLDEKRVNELNDDFVKSVNRRMIAVRKDITSFASIRFSSVNGSLMADGERAHIYVENGNLSVNGKEIKVGYRKEKELVDNIGDEVTYRVISGDTNMTPCVINDVRIKATLENGILNRVVSDGMYSSFFGDIKPNSLTYDINEFKPIDKSTFAREFKGGWRIYRTIDGATLCDEMGLCPMTFVASPYGIGIISNRLVLYKELFTSHMCTITADLIKITDHGFALCDTRSGKCVMADNSGEITEIKLAEWLTCQHYELFDVNTWSKNYKTMKNTYFVTKYDLEELKTF